MISTRNPETKTRFVAQVPQVPAAAGSQVGSDSSYFRGNVIIARIRPSRPPCYTNAIHQAREILRQGSSTMLYMELIFLLALLVYTEPHYRAMPQYIAP